MLEKNKEIILVGEEALEALKEIEFILISLHKIGSFYADKPGAVEEYRRTTTDFIDNCEVTKRLARVRTIILIILTILSATMIWMIWKDIY